MSQSTASANGAAGAHRTELFRSVFDNSLDAIVVIELDGSVLEANAEACFTFGRTLDEMRSAEPAGLLDVADPRTGAAVTAVNGTGRFVGLLTLKRGDGATFQADVSATRFTDVSGRQRICAFVRDVASHELAEKALLASEHRYRSLIETTGTVLIGLSPDGTILEWNREAERIYGCSRAEAIGLSYFEAFLPPEVRPLVRADVAKVLSGHPTRNLENAIRSRDGTLRTLLWNVAPLTSVSGEPIGVIASGQDITELKRLDVERRALEAKVQHAQKLESLGVMAGGIAHDFNNLLVGILGNASLALMDLPEASPLREIVADIETTALRAAELTKQMLAYSGKGRFVIRPVDINGLVREMAHLLQAVISKRATLRVDLAPSLPPVEADATQLRQIVMNLITNASDSLGSSDGVITLRTVARHADRHFLASPFVHDELAEGMYACIEVEDTGCGMDPETLPRIFDPFFSTKFTGRGLGLAATLGIVRGHRGTIKVSSEPGRGTTFAVLLPCASGAVGAIHPPEPAAREPLRGAGSVVVVDDDAIVRTVAGHMLERCGFTVISAADGRQAVEVFSRDPDSVSLVLLDLTMPTLGGDAAFRAMRALKPDVRVVLMSGYSEHEIAGRFGSEQPAGFIQKPFRVEELEMCLSSALRDSSAKRAG